MINYKHLHYFLVVAKEGSIAKASSLLHLTPQTISGQLSVLEDNLNEKLLVRSGRNLVLTETGRLVQNYAEEIFSLGGELEEMVRHAPSERQLLFKVGIVDVVPKSIAYRLIEPALTLPEPVRIICREGSIDTLLSDLALHKLDLVIADEPIPSKINIRGYNHVLGECGISFFAHPKITQLLEGSFPECLNVAPMLLPGETNGVRNYLLNWLEERHIHPKIVGEFDDSALMKAFGQGGAGVFIAPTAIADEVVKQYGVEVLGHTNKVREKYYAISVDRKVSHPAISAVNETARGWLNSDLLS
ncbi:MAG: transcriptional activator NhaR [Gammaproteobacteria bacterium]|nr:transcriptional activator NhaR [Gammaproteobacteria bacterium]